MAAIAGTASACRACISPPPAAALWLGGDVFLAYPAHDRLAPLTQTLRGPGLVNLEGPVALPGERGEARLSEDQVTLLHGEGALEALRRAGVAAVGLANNHRDDAGPDGGQASRARVQAHQLLPVDEAAGVLSLPGLELALTAHRVGETVPPDLASALAEAASRADGLVVTFHTEGTGSAPSLALLEAVDTAVDAGARVVAVHGSHAIGRVERRGGAVVALGLGNLLFDCACTSQDQGLVLQVELFSDGSTGATVVPVQAGLQGAPAQRSPVPDRVLDRLEAMGGAPLVRGEGEAVF